MYLFSLFAPWQETFADAGDGMGLGGESIGTSICTATHYMGRHCWGLCRPYTDRNYAYKPNLNFLGMAHTLFLLYSIHSI